MSEIQGIARLKIHAGKLDDFKAVTEKCIGVVRTRDTGTLQYEIYLNEDQTECVVLERYRDSDALIEHSKNIGKLMEEMMQTCSGGGEVCGNASDVLRKQLDGSPVRVFSTFKKVSFDDSGAT